MKEKTYYTFASGGTFAKYSHEFQTVNPVGEDTIYICEKCQSAINKEIKDEITECPECGGKKFREEKAIEVGNIFKLMNKYSKPFDLSVLDENGKKQELVMGCYGIGIGRTLQTIVEIHHDDKGIIWPKSVAPYQVHLISLGKEGEESSKKAESLYMDLKAAGIEVLLDDRKEGAGAKFADADLIGVPLRLVVSRKSLENGGVEWKLRSETENSIVSFDNIKKEIEDFIAG